MSPVIKQQEIIQGKGVSPGVAIAPVKIIKDTQAVITKTNIPQENIELEVIRFIEAIDSARQELTQIRNLMASKYDKGLVALFDAHIMILEDIFTRESTIKNIRENFANAEYAYQQQVEKIINPLQQQKDEFFRQRINDIRDVCNRVINHLTGQSTIDTTAWNKPRIIIARDLLPSDTASLKPNLLAGFAVEEGGENSHSVILARSMGIPAVIGLKGILSEVYKDLTVIIDGNSGEVILHPTIETIAKYERFKQQQERTKARLIATAAQPACTSDNKMIILSANIGSEEDLKRAIEFHAEGVGLFRTEFMYFQKGKFPSEEEQFIIYQDIAKTTDPHGAIIRFFDIGSDKILNSELYFLEPNPALGLRGIRYLLVHKELLETQIRAILRASAFGKIRMMSPMISTVDEILTVNAIIKKVKNQLVSESIEFDSQIEHGIMIETPSAVTMADSLALESDFFSIGSNDLIQYTLAADRMNYHIAYIYDHYHPAILRAIRKTARSAHRQGIWVGICGEMASDLYIIPLLVGVGIDELSVVPASVPRIKALIRSLDSKWCHDLAERAMRPRTASSMRRFIQRELNDKITQLILGDKDD